jgi:two-component system sensor histidine kinase YesM
LLSCFLVSSIAILSSGIYAYYYFSSIMRQQILQDEQIKLEQIAYQLKNLQADISKTASFILVNDDIRQQINKYYDSDAFGEIVSSINMSNAVGNYIKLQSYIREIRIVNDQEEVIGYGDKYTLINELSPSWYEAFIKTGSYSGFTNPHMLQTRFGDVAVISFVIKYNPLLINKQRLHYLIIDIDTAVFDDYIQSDQVKYDKFVLFNGGNQMIRGSGFSADELLKIQSVTLNSAAQSTYYEEDEYRLWFVNQSFTDGWKLVVEKSTENVMKPLQSIFYFFALSVIFSILLILISLTPIISNITRPISKLIQMMKTVSTGNLNAAITIRSRDELELLGIGFNHMISELRTYIQRTIDDERTKQHLQTELLLAQINPHFIYNTLNSIVYLAEKQGNTDVVNVTQSFIRILQENLISDEEKQMVTIEEEIQYVENYLVIQRYRYPGRIQIEWDIDEQVKQLKVPRMMIQPLVENAIFHGLISSENEGKIQIKILKNDMVLSISVQDDGIGMDSQRIDQIMKGETINSSGKKSHSIGLKNIRERLNLFYGNAGQLSIRSLPNAGTLVSIRMPITEKYTK